MVKIPIPDLMLPGIYQLTPAMLKRRGIKLLLLDLDNTLAPYNCRTPSVALRTWLDGIRKAGIEPFLLSNNRGTRPAVFAKALSLDYIGRAQKPNPKKLLTVLAKKGVSPENAAIVGDQIYTDILCGVRAGVYSVAVRPIDLKNPFRLLRYGLEKPFRMAYKSKK